MAGLRSCAAASNQIKSNQNFIFNLGVKKQKTLAQDWLFLPRCKTRKDSKKRNKV